MENIINNKNENKNETSVDHQLICTICNKPFNDPQCLSCGHTFCHQCITQEIQENHVSCPICQQVVTIDNFPEVNHTVRNNVKDLLMEHKEDKQRTLSSQNIHDPINKASSTIDEHNLSSDITLQQNEQQNQCSAARLFEPFRDLLSDIINQNKQLREELNQMKKTSQLQLNEQSKKNEEYQFEIKQLKNQNQLQLTEQLRRNEELQQCINQLNNNSVEYRTDINRLETNDQNRNTKIQEIDQRHNLLEINIQSLRPIMKYLPDTKWKQEGITKAGGNGYGNQLNQLYYPFGIFIDDDQTIYIADFRNHRIVEWKCNATNGQIVAGENGEENQTNQLNCPRDVIIDKENNSLIICDYGNRRVMRWSRQNNTKNGQIIMSDIDCLGLTMDKDGSIYASDYKKNEVRRWKREDKKGTIVAGGNGKGNHLNQLNWPSYIFVDEDYSLYVSDRGNDRVMKWVKDAKEGMVVAGGNGKGDCLTQLSEPRGVIVDQLGQIYVADSFNHRVMRWFKGAKEGTIVVGGNGGGQQSNQLYRPNGLSFDRQGNLYVADEWNNRIQKFEIN